MKNRILVLGAAGFIGRRIIAALARDPDVTAVAAIRRAAEFPAGVEVLRLDATDAAAVSRAAAEAAGIVNCVAGSAHSILAGARALTAAARGRGTDLRVVHLSSLAVYGSATGEVDESAALKGDLDDYSAAKAAAEAELGGLPSLVMLRPGIVYGPGSPLWSDYIGRLLAAGRLGDLGVGGEGICNLVFVEDVVAAVQRSLTLPGGGIFNLSLNNSPTWNEYFRRYAAALGAPTPRPMSKLRLGAETRLLSPMLKIAELAGARGQGLPPAIRPWLLKICRHRIRMNVARAEAGLGMSWRPLESGLSDTAKWFRDRAQP